MSAMSDFTLMEKENGSLFINSPNALAGNEESRQNTAGAQFQSEQAGNVDFVCETEEDLLEQLRNLVDVLPSDYEAEDAYFDNDDDLNRIIPELNDAAYDADAILKSVSDSGMYIETKAMYAKEMVTAFIRLNGETVGAVANQPVDGEAVLTRNGLEKAERFIKFCDAFAIPLLTVTNVTGLRANAHEERKQALALAKFTTTLAQVSVPRVNLIAGAAYGTAAEVMNSKAIGADFVLAWPQASVGMMDAEQAVRIMYAEEINTDKNKTALIAEKTAEYAEGQSSAFAAAKRGYIDDIIEPDATRKRLIAAYEMLYGKKVTPVTKKHTAV